MIRSIRIPLDPRTLGGILCGLGIALLFPASLVSTALAIEALAAAFWCWARAAPDAREQLPRWAWLRRPAMALWLAVALHVALPVWAHSFVALRGGPPPFLVRLEAIAVVWAGLELVAALPLARPYSDLPGPLLMARPWLPVVLPAAGFVVLWKHATHWVNVPEVRAVAIPLLLLTAVLGALRAFARRQWTASLRWLAVADSALGGLLVALRAMPAEVIFLLWIAACGGHAFLLAGEMHGATPRRGPGITRLWRAASWVALASLSWPVVMDTAFDRLGRLSIPYYLLAAIPVALLGWITVGRMTAAPERRVVPRPDSMRVTSQIGALTVLALGPLALAIAWWLGFESSARVSALALAPAVLGGLGAIAARQGRGRPFWGFVRGLGSRSPAMAGWLFRFVVGIERRLVRLVASVTRAVTAPLRDLHTGDAQEYVLFLVGISVLALLLPLLQ